MGKYLNEANYKKTQKFFIIIAIAILVVGLAVSTLLLVLGIHKKQNPKDTSNYQAQIERLESEMASLETQKTEEFHANGISVKFNSLQNQYDKKLNEKVKLENKIFDAEHDSSHIFLFFGAGVVFLISVSTSISLFVIAYRRNLLAFGAQQVMPIAQEGIEHMAPSIGKASEEISKGITKGIEYMAPTIGKAAEEIGKGITTGIRKGKKGTSNNNATDDEEE